MYVHHMSGETGGTGPAGTGVTDCCEGPCGCWKLNLDLLEIYGEQPVPLTSELSLHPALPLFGFSKLQEFCQEQELN